MVFVTAVVMLLFSVRSSIFSYFRSSRSLSSCSYDFFSSIVYHLKYCDYIFTCILSFFWAVSKQCSNMPVFAEQEVRSHVIHDGVFAVFKMDCECGHRCSSFFKYPSRPISLCCPSHLLYRDQQALRSLCWHKVIIYFCNIQLLFLLQCSLPHSICPLDQPRTRFHQLSP